MLYIPIQIYPNERSVRACIVLAAVFLGLAVAGIVLIEDMRIMLMTVMPCMMAFSVCSINWAATMSRQPMMKVLDDRFSIYTPFGYAMVRFGEVLVFRTGGLPGMRTLRVEINKSARPRFQSGVGRLLYSIAWLNFTNSVAIHSHMLGAQLDPVVKMLEKRRVAAVRLDAIGDYDPTALAEAG